ncbi:rod shape-determining protein MreD [Streptomyces sp. NPDC047108]|uniref:rod shape-determining protein MreD n=1 Tax=Streptomyces sp. NPDC047108 TaxID=3155025 RepID=UPI0033D34430
MRLNRILLSTSLVVVALVVQVSVLARLHIPGAVPDLMLLVVLALALVYGHTAGCVIGFGAGLLSDLAPPADHAVGRYALVLCVTGYLAGLAKPDTGRVRSATGPLLVVVGAAIGTTLMYAGVGALVGDTAARQVGVTQLILTASLYDLLLAPFVVPGVMWLARRAENDPMAESSTSGPAGGTDHALRGFATADSLLGTRSGRGGLLGGLGKPYRSRPRTGRIKPARIKGVKRL